MRKLKPALVRGREASYWRVQDNCLVLRHPRGFDYTEVPIAHLVDERMFEEHLARLRARDWVREPAIDELLEIAAGARA